MKKTAIAALAIFMTFAATACGSLGKPSGKTVTKKYGSDDRSTTAAEDKTTTAENDKSKEGTSKDGDTAALVEEILDDMTLEEKVGQLFFVRADALETGFENSVVNNDDLGGVTYVDGMMRKAMEKYHVGGIMLYEKNIIDPEQLTEFTSELQDTADVPLFIGVKELGGEYAPIANNVNFNVKLFDNMNMIGASGDADKAEILGNEIGKYLASYGVNVDIAPCADISLNSDKVIDKNFSADAGIVSNMVSAEIDGLHKAGVMAAVNHFPGYADSNADGDNIFYNGSLWETILERDAAPFVDSLDKTDLLLVGHIELPAVTDDEYPASMSQQFIQDKIRDELEYKGVIMTDSMAASSITQNYMQGDCAVEAIIAGADIVLTPYDLDKAYRAVLKAAEDGKITKSRINGSVRRILTLKAENGLFDDIETKE